MVDEFSWVLLPWFRESDDQSIHPDDLERVREFVPYGKVFTVLSKESEYATIRYGEDTFRVRPGALKQIKREDSWVFEIGDSVAVRGRDYSGVVWQIAWHHKEQKPIYLLQVNGKPKSRRYWPEELQLR